MYKHYIRLDENDFIIHSYSTAFEEVQDGDILYLDTELVKVNEPRHNHLACSELYPLRDENGNYLNKWVNGELVITN